MPVPKKFFCTRSYRSVKGGLRGCRRTFKKKRYCQGCLRIRCLWAGTTLLFVVLGCNDPVTPHHSRIDFCQNLEESIVTAQGLVERRVAEFAYTKECIRTDVTPDDESDESDKRPTVEDSDDGNDLGR